MTASAETILPHIVYIVGSARSGGTLVSTVIGQLPSFLNVGELNLIWKKGLIDNRLCGCGSPFRDCEFWMRVGDVAFGGWEKTNPREFLALQQRVEARSRVLLLVAPRLWPSYARAFDDYAEVVTKLYSAIQQVSGAGTIVDSSRAFARALLLRGLTQLDVTFIHLVRDSRGVAYSWMKEVVWTDIADRIAYMPTKMPSRVAFRWLCKNALCDVLPWIGVPSFFIRYEDFVDDPVRQIARLFARMHEEPQHPRDLIGQDGSVQVKPSHTVSGNPMRMKKGPIKLRLDDAWRRELRLSHRRMTEFLSWPLLMRYGYLNVSPSGER